MVTITCSNGDPALSDQASNQDSERTLSLLAPFIERLISLIKEDPTLQPEFRCPDDGSSRTYKISAALAARPRGVASGSGNTISFSGGSKAIDDLDPGPEPHGKKPLLFFGGGILILGALLTVVSFFASNGAGPQGCLGVAVMMAGGVAASSAWLKDQDLEARHKEWERRTNEAKNYWWCEACHRTFLPEQKPEGEIGEAQQQSGDIEPSLESPGNVEQLRR